MTFSCCCITLFGLKKRLSINFVAKSNFSIDVIKRKFNLITLDKSFCENYISCYKLAAYSRHNLWYVERLAQGVEIKS